MAAKGISLPPSIVAYMEAKGKSLPASIKEQQEPFRRARRKALDNDEKSLVLLSAHNSCLNSPLDAALPSADTLRLGAVASSEAKLKNLKMSGSTARLFFIGKQNTHTDNDSPIASPLGRNAGEARGELGSKAFGLASSPLGSPMPGSRFAKRNEVDDQHAQLLRSYQKKVGTYFPFRGSLMHQTI
jgi:hypothetical protein